MPFMSKQKREIYRRKVANFWLDFSHNKVGFFGLVLILGFVAFAVLAPVLTPYRPQSHIEEAPKLASAYAMPEWYRIFPQYSNQNPTIEIGQDLNTATMIDQTGPLYIDLDSLTFNFAPEGEGSQTASVTLDLGNITYIYTHPPSFTMKLAYTMDFNRTKLTVYYIIVNNTANPLWEEYFKDPSKAQMKVNEYTPPPIPIANVTITRANIDTEVDDFTDRVTRSLYKSLGETPPSPSSIIFSEPGVFGIQLKLVFQNMMNLTTYSYEGAWANLTLNSMGLTIWGRTHGIMGTDFGGHDAWTELVYGARISLMVGLLAALLATTLGILYGVIAGYLGGFVDEFLMRVVDVLLCIPILPILLILMRFFRPNVYWVVGLIAIFGWQGLSRVIRSKVLTLKEMAFIESARASGASDFYLIIHHLVPNVLPIAMAALVLAVPGAIITEAALSFLGFGDPNAATWGRMLYHAYQMGGLKAWWVWIPPGLAITVICIGFVFMGHAVDEIVNPRLRRRR